MRSYKVLFLALAAVLPASQSFAGGCGGGHAVECYEKVRQPDVYTHVTRPVIIRPALTGIYTRPAVMGARSEKVVLQPGHWQTVRTPAVYADKVERVMVAPAQTTYVDAPAVTRTVRESVVVQPASVRWEHRRGFLGHGERMCKVVVPPVVRHVEREVVVQPARRVAHVTPAVYEHVSRRVPRRAQARPYLCGPYPRSRRLSPRCRACPSRRIRLAARALSAMEFWRGRERAHPAGCARSPLSAPGPKRPSTGSGP